LCRSRAGKPGSGRVADLRLVPAMAALMPVARNRRGNTADESRAVRACESTRAQQAATVGDSREAREVVWPHRTQSIRSSWTSGKICLSRVRRARTVAAGCGRSATSAVSANAHLDWGDRARRAKPLWRMRPHRLVGFGLDASPLGTHPSFLSTKGLCGVTRTAP
jgi:hypothetical protein